MTYLELSVMVKGMLALWTMFVWILLLYNYFCLLQIGNGRSRKRCAVLNILAFAVLLVQERMRFENRSWEGIGALPAAAVVLFLLVLTILACAEQGRIVRWNRSRISDASVKEAMDRLPAGLCYALPEGLPLLVNERMNRIHGDLFDTPLMNALETWNKILKLPDAEKAPDENWSKHQKIVRLPDGSIVGFQKRMLSMEEGDAVEITAADLTREFRLTEELQEKERRARAMNVRLKFLMETIGYMTMSRELFQLKVALHDNMGKSLILTRKYCVNPCEEDRIELLRRWSVNMGILIGEGPEDWQVPYYVISKEAERLGIRLEIGGKLPEEEWLLPVVDQAISAHVTNVLRHAEGTVARVRVTKQEQTYELSFTNDGRAPEGEVRETGGLANLRRTVEEAGGRMEIRSLPVFEMRLTFPREEGELESEEKDGEC